MEGKAVKDDEHVNNLNEGNPAGGNKCEDKDGDVVPPSCSKIPREEDEDDFVPNVEYPPVISLPPLVNRENPHEDEEIIFQGRAKLYCFDNSKRDEDSGSRMGQWVERGLGLIKILQSKDTEKKHRVRVVMWRENVNTIACNHWLNCIVSLTKRTERVLLWSALDFAFDCPRVELFSCNFSSTEDCGEFMDHLESFIASIPPAAENEGNSYSEDVEKLLKPLSDLFGKEEGSWVCTSCLLSNGPETNSCPACDGEKEKEPIPLD